jgi:transcriptional regulator with XRE-family HTH domain
LPTLTQPAPTSYYLRILRTRRGQRSKEVAQGAGIPPSILSRIELGRQEPRANLMFRILDAMGASLAELEKEMQGDEMI